MGKYRCIAIGVDQSYSNTGISIAADGGLVDIKSIQLHKYGTNSDRRSALGVRLSSLLGVVAQKSYSVVCICERARLYGRPASFINIDAIKAMGALTAVIVDACHKYGVKVYSVDTRCWKSRVVGTSKPMDNEFGVPPEKWPTVRWCIDEGFEHKILLPVNGKKVKGTFVRRGQRYMYNNDASDSAGIAMYWFVGDRSKLKLEV